MSILLDALRKSEQRERLGAAPDIHSDVIGPQGAAAPRWRTPALLVIGVAVVLAGGYGLWRYVSGPTVPVAPPEFTQAADGGTAAGVSGTRPAGEPVNATEGVATPGEGAPTVAVTETASSADDASNRRGVDSGPTTGVARATQDPAPPRFDRQPRSPVENLSGERPYQPAPASAANPAVASTGRPVARATEDAPERTVERAPPTPRTVEIPTTEAALARAQAQAEAEMAAAAGNAAATQQRAAERSANAEPPATRTPARAAPANEPKDDSISYWQLPENVRSGLPELRINVMVFDEDPGRRFVILGGKRYAEGAEIAKNLSLEEVRRDRALFRYGAYLFFVKQ